MNRPLLTLTTLGGVQGLALATAGGGLPMQVHFLPLMNAQQVCLGTRIARPEGIAEKSKRANAGFRQFEEPTSAVEIVTEESLSVTQCTE